MTHKGLAMVHLLLTGNIFIYRHCKRAQITYKSCELGHEYQLQTREYCPNYKRLQITWRNRTSTVRTNVGKKKADWDMPHQLPDLSTLLH